MSGICIIGAGGHAKVVIGLCRAAGITVECVLDDNLSRDGSTLLDVPVHAPVRDHLPKGARAVVAIGDNAIRLKVAAACDDLVGEWVRLVHPRAFVDPTAVLGQGSVVFAGAVVQPSTVIGDHVIINTCASVDHDGVLGDGVHLAPGVHLAGNVTIGAGAFLGVGVAVIPGRSIGAGSIVGAGGAVVHDVAENVVVVGVPAKERARLTPKGP